MDCPKCGTAMLPTYEPYEERCIKCGYWFDHWTGKEKEFNYVEHCLICGERREECRCARLEFEFDAKTIQQWSFENLLADYDYRFLLGYVVVGEKVFTPLQFLHWIEREIEVLT